MVSTEKMPHEAYELALYWRTQLERWTSKNAELFEKTLREMIAVAMSSPEQNPHGIFRYFHSIFPTGVLQAAMEAAGLSEEANIAIFPMDVETLAVPGAVLIRNGTDLQVRRLDGTRPILVSEFRYPVQFDETSQRLRGENPPIIRTNPEHFAGIVALLSQEGVLYGQEEVARTLELDNTSSLIAQATLAIPDRVPV